MTATVPAWEIRQGWLTMTAGPAPGPDLPVRVSRADGDAVPRPDTPAARSADGRETVYRDPEWVVRDAWQPAPQQETGFLLRTVSFTNAGTEPADILRAECRLSTPSAEGGPARSTRLWATAGLTDGRLLFVGLLETEDSARLERQGDSLRGVVDAQWRLPPGETAVLARQAVAVVPNTPADLRRCLGDWYALQGLGQPMPYPPELLKGVLYEASAAGHIDSRFSDTGGFDAFARQVPYLAELGVTALWLNAVQSHKTPPDPGRGGWNHYDPRDLLAVDPILGGAEGLSRLSDALEGHDILLLSEIVPHGGHSAQAEALPQWWSRNRDGSLRKNWGGFGMDNASPDWQRVIRDSMAMVSRHAKVSGARIDVADGQGPNWGAPRDGHASFSGIGAGVEILEAVRDGIAAEGCATPVLIPESPLRPVYFGIREAAVLGYGFEFADSVRDLSAGTLADPSALAGALREFFIGEEGTRPPGTLTIRTLNNHDTVCSEGRTNARFGAGLHRALYGVCLAVPGVPMLYQEEETGSFFALRQLNDGRRRLPILATSEAEYPAAGFFDPRVFAVLRREGRDRVLCLVNLSADRIRSAAPFPGSSKGKPRQLTDAVSGATTHIGPDGEFDWKLGPYSTALLSTSAIRTRDIAGNGRTPGAPATPPRMAVEQADNGECEITCGSVSARFSPGVDLPPEAPDAAGAVRFASPAGTVTFRREGNGMRVTCDLRPGAGANSPVIRVRGAATWGASCRTGVLHDRVFRRHFPFPEGTGYSWSPEHCWGKMPWGELYAGRAPTDRLWESVVEPLHPENPALSFADATGAGMVLTDIRSDAENIVLSGADELSLSFHASDPMLAPGVRLFGRGQPWRITGEPDLPPRGTSLSFLLTPARQPEDRLADAPPLPFRPPGAALTRNGPRFADNGGRIFVVEPGSLEWSDIGAVPGVWAVEMELRLSERSGTDTDLADAYRVLLDGRELAFEWGRKDVWSTGNAYFALARTVPVELGGSQHTLRIETTKPWCAVRPSFALIPHKN